MFANRLDLFRLFGFRVSLDLSWILIAIFLTWSLASGYFPWAAPGFATATYWWMGVVGALGLFVSIVLHELAHALVARRFDLPIGGITLFVFGGIAEMEDEPETPEAEFWMAIAGPIASVVIGVALYLVYQAGGFAGAPSASPVGAVLGYLAMINIVLAVFNMLPAFPLDGGRILRAGLWWWKQDLTWATRVAAASGAVLAALLIALGVVNILGGAFVAGIWQMLLGFFLYNAAAASRASTEIRHGLRGVRVERVMKTDVVTVPPTLSVLELIDDYFYRYHLKLFPVVGDDGRLAGCVHLSDVNAIERDAWPKTRIADVMQPCDARTTISADKPVLEALRIMQEVGRGRLVVVTPGGRLAGVITADDVMGFIAIRNELRRGGPRSGAGQRPGQVEALEPRR